MKLVWLILMALGVPFLAWRALIAIAEARAWPQPMEMPFWCAQCRHGFRTGKLFTMHINHQHDQRYGPLKARMDKLKVARKKRKAKAHLKLV